MPAVRVGIAILCALVALAGCGSEDEGKGPVNMTKPQTAGPPCPREQPLRRQCRFAKRIAAAHSPATKRAMRRHCRVKERPYKGGVGGFVSQRCARILHRAFKELPPHLQRLIRESSESPL